MGDKFVFSRNLQDSNLNPAAFALPSAAGSVTSAVIDLEANVVTPSFGLDLNVPALNVTMVPDTRTVTYIIESSATSNFAAVDQTLLTETYTGTGGTGAPAFNKRVRTPPNCARYVRAKITTGASTGDASSLTAAFSARF